MCSQEEDQGSDNEEGGGEAAERKRLLSPDQKEVSVARFPRAMHLNPSNPAPYATTLRQDVKAAPRKKAPGKEVEMVSIEDVAVIDMGDLETFEVVDDEGRTRNSSPRGDAEENGDCGAGLWLADILEEERHAPRKQVQHPPRRPRAFCGRLCGCWSYAVSMTGASVYEGGKCL